MQSHRDTENTARKKVWPFLLGAIFGLLVSFSVDIVLCQTGQYCIRGHDSVTILDGRENTYAVELLAFLKGQGGKIVDNEDGTVRIMNTVENRRAILRYMEICHERIDLCTCNLANRDVTLNEKGEAVPYRAKYLEAKQDGSSSVKEIEAKPIYRYEPANPNAIEEGDLKGYVAYPCIHATVEIASASLFVRQEEHACQIMKQFNPTFVHPSTADRVEHICDVLKTKEITAL